MIFAWGMEKRGVFHIRVSLNNVSIALLIFAFIATRILVITIHLKCMSVETHWHKSRMGYSASENYFQHDLYISALNGLPW